jgi:hypothetical protein
VGVLIINKLQNQKGTKKGKKEPKRGRKGNQKGGNGTFQEQKMTFLLLVLLFFTFAAKTKIQLYGTQKRAYFTS